MTIDFAVNDIGSKKKSPWRENRRDNAVRKISITVETENSFDWPIEFRGN